MGCCRPLGRPAEVCRRTSKVRRADFGTWPQTLSCTFSLAVGTRNWCEDQTSSRRGGCMGSTSRLAGTRGGVGQSRAVRAASAAAGGHSSVVHRRHDDGAGWSWGGVDGFIWANVRQKSARTWGGRFWSREHRHPGQKVFHSSRFSRSAGVAWGTKPYSPVTMSLVNQKPTFFDLTMA